MDDQDQGTAQAELNRICYDLLVVDRRGRKLLEYLIARYAKGPVTKGGIDAILQTFGRAAQRELIDDLLSRASTHESGSTGVPTID